MHHRPRVPVALIALSTILSGCGDIDHDRIAATTPTTPTTHTQPDTSTESTTMIDTHANERQTLTELAAFGRWVEGLPRAAREPVTASLEPCGGDLPPCAVKAQESGGNYQAVNPTGCGGRSCGGAWQFDPRTWGGYGGYTYAQDAPPDVQDARARELWAGGAGCAHWNAC